MPTSSPPAAPSACAAKAAVDDGHADAVTGFRTEAIERDADDRLVLVGEDGRRLDAVDEVIVLTGLRPDLSFLSEIRLGLDERLQAPAALAPLIDPNQHSCGTVYPHGHRELAHPEQGIYLVGMKSYGRAPTFLAMTGYEQVRSVAAAIAGDHRIRRPRRTHPPRDRSVRRRRTVRRPRAAEARRRRLLRPAPQLVQLGAPSAVERCRQRAGGGRLLRLVTDLDTRTQRGRDRIGGPVAAPRRPARPLRRRRSPAGASSTTPSPS